VKAAFGAGFGVAPGPGGGVHREHVRPVRWPVVDQQTTETVLVDPAKIDCLVEAAVTASEHRFKAQ